MRVLLTGATGFIGRCVLSHLSRLGVECVCVGRTRPDRLGSAFIQADILKAESLSALMESAKPTHLVHLAWYVEHGAYWHSPLNLRWVEATVRLVEAFCAAGGRQVVATGTCAEYDWVSGYCREDVSPLRPATLYGVSKDATRRLISGLCQAHRIPCAWGRIFQPYGPGENSQRLFPSLAAVFQGRRAPFGVNAKAYRDFLHIEDVAGAIVQMMLTGADGCYNIASAEPVRIEHVVHQIARMFGADADAVLNLATERPNEPHMLVGDNSLLRAMGWRAKRPLAEISLADLGLVEI